MRVSTRSALVAATAGALVLGGVGVFAGQGAAAQTAVTPAVASGGITVAYYDQWSIYQNAYYLHNLDASGAANKINYLIYDFENIDPVNLTCFEASKATDPDPAGENDSNAGDGAEDSFADYQKEFDATTSVNGTADVFNQPLAGNFHQLQELKAKHPNLKILLSLGGWTYSKYFSDAAATAASRQKLVSSCIDMFIKGNIPASGGFGGPGTAAGIFDGFDIDWEYPGSAGGHLGNHVSPNDTADYTALLAEFRSELNTQGTADGKTYALTAALPAGQDKISKIQTNQIAQYLTFGDVMTYDMHGGFETTGPTNFADPLFQSPNDPSSVIAPGTEKYSSDNAIKAWTVGDPGDGIPGGFPASKLTLGIPFYYRGWTGVPAGANHGLYEPASGPGPGAVDSGSVPGIEMYKELTSVVTNPADTFFDPVSDSAYFYDGTNFWTGESAQSIKVRMDYVHCMGLAGTMMFSMYDLNDPTNTLFNDVVTDLAGTTTTCPTPPGGTATAPPPTTTAAAPPPTTTVAAPPPTTTVAAPPPTTTTASAPPAGNLISNGGFESGALSPWTCDAGTASVVASPAHAGTHALAAAATSSDDAQCTETVTVQPSHTYTLGAWVEGNFAFIGATGTGGTDPSTFTQAAPTYTHLTTTFTTGAATTSVTVFVHGWFAQGTVDVDDVTLS
ncbi:MAG TPA: glycosyl hydrolase family 18 protein [Pseudonocardiaceae bacterium]|nr:glycosyl hydrolase family 18 protein [Pseudonocardiaceae bacterium]